MAARGILAGSAFVRLGADVDRSGFEQFEREHVKAQKAKDISARLGADFDSREFDMYERRLKEARERTNLRGAIKATLGADYDSRAFNAYYRDLVKARAAAASASNDTNLLSRSFKALAGAAGGAGGSIGGGAGLGGRFGFLGSVLPPLLGTLAALTPVLLAVAGAATAVAGSLAAAAAGASAVGVGIAAALGPLAAVAIAVAARVASLTDAYKALGTEQTKGGVQAKANAEAQRAAAERVRAAQDNLTKARFTARREVEDLTAAVIRSTLAEKDAALALRQAQESSAAVLADPRSTALQRAQAVQDVKDAKQRTSDAATERQRALVDERRGTDTLRQAQLQLTDARHAATIASQKEGAAATDAGQKLAKLSDTERQLVIDFKVFVDQLTEIFKPATDAILASVDSGLQLITPLLGRYKGQFAAIGDSIAGVIDEAVKSLTGPGWTHALDSFVATAQSIVKPIGDSVGSVLLILRNIAVATQPYVVELANNIRDALGGLADKTKDPAKVRDVIKGLVDQTKSWLGFMGAVAKLIFTIFSGGARQGQGLLDQITRIVKRWTAFLETDEGQRKMREFFKDSIKLTKQIAGFLADVAGAFYDVGRFLQKHTDLIKVAIGAWAAYRTAAILALGVSKGAAVASFIRGPAAAGPAAGAVGAVGPGARAAGGAAGGAAAGALGGVLGIGLSAAAFAALKIAMDQIERRSKRVAEGFRVASNYAKQMVEAGNPGAIHALAGSIDEWGKKAGATGDEIKRLKDALGDLEVAAERNVGGVGKALDQAAKHFADFRKTGSNNLHGIHTAVEDNMHFIKRTLGEDSEAGKKALVGNFKLAEEAIRDAMTDGKISTRDGLKEIRRLMKQELAVYGITGQQATDYLRVSGHGSGNETRGGGHAGGGWIGQPGMVGTDTVPAMLAPGEAVLNRHQQAVIEGMLGGGFLDSLFENVKTPHYFAAGGYVQGAQPPLHAPAKSLARDMFSRGFSVTSAYRSDSSTYHGSGDALDFGNSVNDLGKVWGALFPKRAQFAELFGPQGLFHFGQRFQDSDLQAGHNDHVHVAILKALSGAIGSAAGKIKAPTVRGGGALGGVVSGVLKGVARGADSRLGQIVDSLGGGHTGGGGKTSAGGKYDKAALMALWKRAGGRASSANIAAAIALAESGGDPNAGQNHPYHGLWQIGPGGPWDPLANAKEAVRKSGNGRDWTPWTTYTGYDTPNHEKTYLRYLARGGFVQRFASGGLVKPILEGTRSVGDTMKQGWKKMRRMLPGNAPDTAPDYVVSDLVPGNYAHASYALHGGRRRVALTPAMVRDLRAGSGPEYARALHALTHEWAHTQQLPTLAGQPSWMVEGGAEAFARDHDAGVWGGKARSYGAYSDFVGKVRNTKWLGKRFINSGQFIGGKVMDFAKGGFAGRALRFATGGRVPSASGGSAQRTTGSGTTGRTNISQLRGTQRIRVKEYDDLTTSIADEERRYGQAERRYNQSDEILIDPKTGQINQGAIEKRAGELAALMKIRERILGFLEKQLTIARRVVKTYTTIIGRLTRSLKHAKGKDRTGIRADIAAYTGERDTWRTNAKTVGFDIGDAKLDIGDLQKEGSELRGTVAETSSDSSASTGDGGSSDSGSGGSDTSNPDVDAIIAQFQENTRIAQANLTAANQVISAFSSSGDIGTGGSNAFNAVSNEAQPVGAQFAPAGSLAARSITGGGGATVINNYNMPGAPNVLRAIGDAATAGQSLQPSIGASVTKLGI